MSILENMGVFYPEIGLKITSMTATLGNFNSVKLFKIHTYIE
jgi:hypothetical protein